MISDGYCLRLYHNYVEWSEAKEACEGLGSELVNITISSDLLNAARLLLTRQSVGEIWISAHSAKRWLWVGKFYSSCHSKTCSLEQRGADRQYFWVSTSLFGEDYIY